MAASSGDSATLHAAAMSAIASSSHPSNSLGVFSPDLLRMSGHTRSMENKTDSELGVKQFEGVGSGEITAQTKSLVHVTIKGIGLYIDGSESTEVMYELARLKANSIVILNNNWRLTSSEYQTSNLPPVPQSRMPWIFIPAADGAFFGSLMLKRSLYVNNKDMCSASLVYSREGWLMFLSVPEKQECDCQVFLLNPFSGEMLTLPPAPHVGGVRIRKAAFTIRDGRPDLVIFPGLKGRNVRILLARPGDEKWEEHTARVLSKYVGLWDSLLCARCVYCFFDDGMRLMVFHLDGQYWSTYGNINTGTYLLEFEGKVLTVDPPLSYVTDGDKGFKARELIIRPNEASVVSLNDTDLRNRSWFLGPQQSFCARMMGQKVHQFRMAPPGKREDYFKFAYRGEREEPDRMYCVYYHDLLKKKFRLLTPDAFCTGHGWVDLGGVLVTRHPRTRASHSSMNICNEKL
uniref:KIB1-4 beta-propeller domain-containing protein n=1 Tax=Arundo donax TaxID=35708 RepID=A0A0A9A166_ARUDO